MAIVRYSYPTVRSFAPSGYFSPWSGLENEIDRLFGSATPGSNGGGSFPVEVDEDKENVYVRAELPGVNREDINVELVEDTLTLSASRKRKTGDEEKTVSASRSVTVGERVQADKVSASYQNGVLTVALPKQEEAKPRKIAVEVK